MVSYYVTQIVRGLLWQMALLLLLLLFYYYYYCYYYCFYYYGYYYYYYHYYPQFIISFSFIQVYTSKKLLSKLVSNVINTTP